MISVGTGEHDRPPARIGVLVVAYNAESTLRWVLDRLPESFRRRVDHVLVGDDASHDDTYRVGLEYQIERDLPLTVIRHAENRGVGAAIITGYRRARALGADVVAVMAGDGQMDPADLERVLRPIVDGEADYVKGNRLRHPGVLRTMPPARLAGTAVLAWLTRHAAGLPLARR